MRTLVFLALLCAPLGAQNFTATLLGANNAPAGLLSASYAFADTPQGGSSSFTVTLTNNGPGAVNFIAPKLVGDTTSFKIGAYYSGKTLAPGLGTETFTVSFTPGSVGQFSADLQIVFQVQTNGCTFGSVAPACTLTQTLSSLTGSATAPQWLLTYNNGAGYQPLQPSNTAPLQFPDTSLSAASTVNFQLSNPTSSPVDTPGISITGGVYSPLAFALGTASLPATIPPNQTLTFAVTFAPGQAGLTSANLVVGPNTYPINGWGVASTPVDALQIYYVDATGVRTSPQAATPISFGQRVPGAAGGTALTFTLTNPQTSFDPVAIPVITVTGSAYKLSGTPALPATLQPGSSLSFAITFSAASSGTYTGTLAIGSRTFQLTGLSVVSPVPALSLHLSESTLTSAQQVTATVEAASASAQDAVGTLTMQFAPSIPGVNDDPAVMFLATGGRSLSLTLAKGSQTAAWQGQSALAFQTGTTAGTLTFTLTFTNTPPITQSFTITPAQIHISSAAAVRSDPYLVVTVNGFDNTYSAGQMAFTFYDLKGNALNATPMEVDATSDFHQYFFGKDAVGGSFAVQAKFPVKGGVTGIGAVAVTMDNTAGQAGTKIQFQ